MSVCVPNSKHLQLYTLFSLFLFERVNFVIQYYITKILGHRGFYFSKLQYKNYTLGFMLVEENKM